MVYSTIGCSNSWWSQKTHTYHIELDSHLYGYDYENKVAIKNTDGEFKSRIKKSIIAIFKDRKSNVSSDRLIIDGLFTNNGSLLKIIEMIKSIKGHYKSDIKIRIIHFHGDEETCLWNDKGRFDRFAKDKNAKVTIKNTNFEKLNFTLLKSHHKNIEVIDVSVFKKPLIKNFMYDDGSDYTSEKIKSDTWDTGGTWNNCWDTGGNVGEEPPVVVDELVSLLVKCGATHIYDDIIQEISTIEEDSESDYYGGCREYSWYEIQIEELENYLKERGFLRNLIISDLISDSK